MSCSCYAPRIPNGKKKEIKDMPSYLELLQQHHAKGQWSPNHYAYFVGSDRVIYFCKRENVLRMRWSNVCR